LSGQYPGQPAFDPVLTRTGHGSRRVSYTQLAGLRGWSCLGPVGLGNEAYD